MKNSPKIILLTTGLRGRFNSCLELSRRLTEHGSVVTIASPWDCSSIVKQAGFTYLKLPEIPLSFTQFRTSEEALGKLHLRETSGLLFNENPTLILIDHELPFHVLIGLSLETPIALIQSWFDIERGRGYPSLKSSAIPGLGWSGSKFGIDLAWFRFNLRSWYHHTSKKMRWGNRSMRSIIRLSAAHLDVDLHNFVRKGNSMAIPFTWKNIPILSMNLSELDFPHQLKKDFFYVGSMVYDQRLTFEKSHPFYDQISEVLQKAQESNRKIIYCSLSTMSGSDFSHWAQLVQSVSENPNWIMIIGGVSKDLALPKSQNIFSYDSAPQLTILNNADLSINQGGINTINECIHTQVPMLIVSGGRFDQNGSAARVEYHQLGIRVGQANFSKYIKEVFNDPRYAKNIAEMRLVHLKYQEDNVLESVIKKLIN